MQKCFRCHEYYFLQDGPCSCISWDYYHSEEKPTEDFYSVFIKTRSPGDAAEHICERNFADWDYPTEIDIWVRESGDMDWKGFDVNVESVPEFSAREKSQ
ncbi:MAG: hypothetical protein ACR2QF_13945 [Geminicoccaceae bacterium]